MDQLLDYQPGLKKYLGWYTAPLLFAFVAGLFTLAFWFGVSGWRVVHDLPEKRQMSFSGEGKVAAKPDVAVFSASVMTSAKKVKDAQRENSDRSNTIMGFLKGQGVAEKDIKTTNYVISPQYQYFDSLPCTQFSCPPRKPPEVVSYQVRHSIEIKVRDLDKVDDLLDGVVSNGANEVGSIDFRIDDEEKVKAGARKKAIDQAKEKARTLTSDLGVRLGRIIAFSESGGEPPIYYSRALEAKDGFGGGVSPAPQVAPGEEELRVSVTITYEFR